MLGAFFERLRLTGERCGGSKKQREKQCSSFNYHVLMKKNASIIIHFDRKQMTD